MNRKLFALRAGAIVAGLLLAFTAIGPVSARQLTVVELFSAQGCPLCPPAEAYLGELAMRDDVLPLAFHVDYWDYLGWRDRFADAGFARRQQRYSERLGLPYVYTPQIVVDGRMQASGGKRDEVEANIAKAASHADDGIEVEVIRLSPTRLRIILPEAKRSGPPADIVLIGFDAMHVTDITRGENSGLELTNYHVVRDVKSIANWDGSALDISVPLMENQDMADFCAVLVQEAGQGPIIAAASIDMRVEDPAAARME